MPPFSQNSPGEKKAAKDRFGTLFRDTGAVAAACTTELENPSGVWGQTAPTRVWAAPTVLRLGLVLSPESGRGAATPRTRRVPPVLKSLAAICAASAGGTRVFRVRVRERVVLRATARTQARVFLRDCYLVPGGAKTGRAAERLRHCRC